MPRVYKKKTPEEGGRAWYDPKTLLAAIEAIKMGKMNKKTAAAFYGVPRSSLIRKMNGAPNPGVSTAGRRLEFSEEEEENLVRYLKIISVCGEGLTKTQTRDLVQEYVKKYNIKTRFRDGRPGYDWYINFIKRHPCISRKRYEIYSMERCGSRDVEPFQVYKFFEDLQKLYNQSNYTEDDGNLIYTFDECEFLWHTQDETKTEKVLNPSVLACGSASGQQLSPFLLFKGKFVQAPWAGTENRILLESESELTEHSLFETWFHRVFLSQIDPLPDRLHKPVTLIFNGFKSQTKNALTLDVFEQCVEHKINLVRLPSSLIWELQPLQKSCFKEMKTAWNNWKSKQDLSRTLSKNTFVCCLNEIWNNNVTAENLILGFGNSGIFPVNQKLFPKRLFRPSALWRYEARVTEHIPETVVIDNKEDKNEIKLEVIECTVESDFSTLTPDVKSVDELSSGKDPLHPVVREEQGENSNAANGIEKTIGKKRVANKFGKIMLMNKIIRQRAMFAKYYKAKGKKIINLTGF